MNIHINDSDFNVDFWRFGHIKEQDFLSEAETGDIVLFRGSHLGAKLTRTWTQGAVDHAAMVIRLEKYDQIFLLESVMVKGVSLISWPLFKRTNKVYNQLFYRKLICNRDDEFYDKFDEFLQQVQGN